MPRRKNPAKTSKSRPKSRAGYVYILTNKALKDDWVKIGRTIRPPEVRAAEISRSTGVPLPFEVHHREWVSDCVAAEKEVHQALAHLRANQSREFFVLPPSTAVQEVEKVCRKYQKSLTGRLRAITGRTPRIRKRKILMVELLPALFLQTFGVGSIYAGGVFRGVFLMLWYWTALAAAIYWWTLGAPWRWAAAALALLWMITAPISVLAALLKRA